MEGRERIKEFRKGEEEVEVDIVLVFYKYMEEVEEVLGSGEVVIIRVGSY